MAEWSSLPHHPQPRPILQRLRQVTWPDALTPGQVRDRARRLHQRFPRLIQPAELAQLRREHIRVARNGIR